MNFKNLVAELKRRNVFKVATVYGITGWLIIQVITSISEPLSLPPWFDTAIIILVLIGFPLSLIFAWAFEMTPDGLKKTKQVVKDESISNTTGKKLNRLIITTLTLLLAFLVYERFFVHDHEEQVDKNILPSIAVLPFEDYSPKNDQEYFSDGLSEELLNVLAKVNGIKVPGRTSSFKFKGKHEDLKLVGQQLGVDHILEGSVRKSGNQIRITAQLIKVSDGFHMWSETYDEEYSANNLFKIQDKISKMILKELKIKLSIEDTNTTTKAPTSNTEAYDAYLKGNQLLVNRNPQEILQAIEEFNKAITLDSKFAAAYAKLAIAYYHSINYAGFNRDKGVKEIRDNANHAILLDNTLAVAYAALGHFYSESFDREKAKIALKRAHELEPNNAEIIMWYSKFFPIIDDTGLELLLKAYQIDPLSPIVVHNLATEYQFKGNFEKAKYYYQVNNNNNPDYVASKISLISMLGDSPNGKLDEAFIESYKAYKLNPKNLQLLEYIFSSSIDLKLIGFAKSIRDSIQKNYPENIQNQFISGQIEMLTGDVNKIKQVFTKMMKFQLSIEMNSETKERENAFLKMINGDYKAALKKYAKIYPKLVSDTISVINQDELHDYFPEIIIMLEKTNAHKQEKKLRDIYFSTIKKSFKHNGDITKESLSTLRMLKSYYSTTITEVENYVKIIEEEYFKRKSKSLNSTIDEYLRMFSPDISNSKQFLELRKRIDEDINIMRAKAIEFLKSEGVWEQYKE